VLQLLLLLVLLPMTVVRLLLNSRHGLLLLLHPRYLLPLRLLQLPQVLLLLLSPLLRLPQPLFPLLLHLLCGLL
jgi:hypothetical protein